MPRHSLVSRLVVALLLAALLGGLAVPQARAAKKLQPGCTHIVGTAKCLAFYRLDTGAFAVRPVADGRLGARTFNGSTLPVGGTQGWTQMAGTGKYVFFYHRPTKQSRAYPVNARCKMASSPTDQSGFGDWTHVVGIGEDMLLFYNYVTGAWGSGLLTGNGLYTHVTGGTFATGWIKIVAAGNRVFWFNPNAPAGTTNAATGVGDATGHYTHKENYGFDPGWRRFAGTRNGGFLISNFLGKGMTGRLDAEARWVLFDDDVDFSTSSPTWETSPVVVAGGGTRSVLFYNQNTGQAVGGYLNGQGKWTRTVRYGR